MFFVVEKYVLFDPIQIRLFSFLGVMFPANGFADSFEKFFLGFGFILIDIITYRDILMDKLLQITLYPVIMLIIFPRITISIECLEIDSYSMRLVEIEH